MSFLKGNEGEKGFTLPNVTTMLLSQKRQSNIFSKSGNMAQVCQKFFYIQYSTTALLHSDVGTDNLTQTKERCKKLYLELK